MRQILVLVVLVLVMQVVLHHGVTTSAAFDSLTLLTTGFILIGAYAMGELFRRLRLPALLGYLAAGVLFGPELLGLLLGDPNLAPIGRAALGELGLVNVLAIGVIGTIGGGEIQLPTLRENFAKIAAICALVFAVILPLVAAVVLGLTFVAPSLVPFLAELPLAGRIAGALLFATLAVGMSPAATLALMQEVHAQGRLSALILGVVVFADLLLVATFLVILALAKLMISPEGLSWISLRHELPIIAGEFAWALVLGLVVGLTFIAYLRFVGREVLLFSLAVVFVTAFVAARLHAETLVAFLVAGFTVQNLSRHGHVLVHAFERIALPVFVLYFTAQAAALDLLAVTVYLPLTLILVGLRSSGFWLAIGAGARWAGADEATRRHLQLSFFSQGGVDLVLAAMVAEAIPSWGAEVQTVTMATVLIYIVVGPPLLARSLDGAGESAAARERGAEQLAASAREVPSAPALPRFDRGPPELAADPELAPHLAPLHAALARIDTELFEGDILARCHGRSDRLRGLARSITAALEPSAPGDNRPADAARARARLVARLASADTERDQLRPPLDAADLAHLVEALDRSLDFAHGFRVVMAPALFLPQGTPWTRGLRLLRRLRRALAGPGRRTVLLGRLWRFHVALAVPVLLWRATRPSEARLWQALLDHDRLTRASLDALAEADEPADDDWAAALAEARARERALDEALAQVDAALEARLSASLAQGWRALLTAAALAGTFEDPNWRSRPSLRYDAARAAVAELSERSRHDGAVAAGRYDALLAQAHGEHVAEQVRASNRDFVDRFIPVLDELGDGCERLLTTPAAAAEIGELQRMAAEVEQLRRALSASTGRPTPALTRALALVPERLAPGDLDATIDDEAAARRTSIDLRTWLAQTLVHDFETARANRDDALGLDLERFGQALLQIARVVEYHRDADSTDAGLRGRVHAMLERARAQVQAQVSQITIEVDDAIATAERSALAPIHGGRWDELRRRQRRHRGPRLTSLQARGDAWVGTLRARARALADELSALSRARQTPSEVERWRQVLLGPRASTPEPYQRLFTSVPAEAVGLLIPRPELAVLLAAGERWLAGGDEAILIHGDRGVGKRTLVRQLQSALGDRVAGQWLRLSPGLEREDELVQILAERLSLTGAIDDLPGLQRRIEAELEPTPRPLIVVENGERLFRRSADGLALLRRFLALLAATRGRILWVVVLAEPAVPILDAALALRAHFPTCLQVPTLTGPELAALLDGRHRLSGYGLRLLPGTPTLADWIRAPRAAWRLWRNPEDAGFARLTALSGGNIRQALRLWLATARVDDHGSIVVGPLPACVCPLLDELPTTSRLLLAALLLHGPLTPTDLGQLRSGARVDLDAELAQLSRLGLISRDGRHGMATVTIDTRLIQPLTTELRACNLL